MSRRNVFPRDARGMTLVELMIVLTILSLVAGAILSVFMASLKAYWKGGIATQVQQGARLSADRLGRELRQARRLYSGTNGGFTFAVTCTPNPQISFALPHFALATLTDGSTIYTTDANASGQAPYDGSFVSYYLAAAQNSTVQNSSGPYLERTAYDAIAGTLTTSSVASNVTSLAFSSGGACPTLSAREITVTVTASQQSASQNVSSTDVLSVDITLRNQ
jgi:prepilin-type N-terminal cleavage/methylation domain-containing protein